MSPWKTIFKKEFRETFRDKRTKFGVILSPLLLTPALLGMMGSFITGMSAKKQTESYTIGVVNADKAPGLAAILRKVPHSSVQAMEAGAAEAQIKDRKVRIVVVLPPDGDTLTKEGRSAPVRILLDEGNEKSQSAAGRVEEAFTEAGAVLLTQRIKRLNLPEDFARPFKLAKEPIKSGGNMGMLIVSSLLPYMLTLACFSGGIYAANDSVAGEKERGTLETLLASRASRKDIVLGKFASVAAVCLVSSLLSIVGLIIPFFSGLSAYAWLVKGGITLSPMGVLVVLVMQLPLAVLFAGLLLAISTFARNQKEAQTYLGPVMILIVIPAMFSMVMGAEAPITAALVPVLNASIIIKQALLSSYDFAFIGVALAASVAYAAAAVIFATRIFQKEGVLLKV